MSGFPLFFESFSEGGVELPSGESLAPLLFGFSLFLMAYLSGLTVCRCYGSLSQWWGCLPLPLAPLYAALGKLVVGGSPTRFSLLSSARISRGGILLAWWAVSVYIVMGFWQQRFKDLSPLGAHTSFPAEALPAILLFPAAALSTVLFLWEGFASRTVACAFCLSEGPEESAGGEVKPKKRQYDNPDCLHDSRNRPAPCRPGQFSWPSFPLEEAGSGKQDSRAIEVVAEDVLEKYEETSNSKEGQVDFDFQDSHFGYKKGGQRKEGGGAEPTQRDKDLPERCRLKGPRSRRVSAEPARHGGNAEDRFSGAPPHEVGATDPHQSGAVAENAEHQEVSRLVEDGVEPGVKEEFCNRTDGGEERTAHGKRSDFVEKILNIANHFCLLLLCAFYLLTLPLNAFFLLPTAVRSRFDRWLSSDGWAFALSVLAWAATWFADLLAFGYVGGFAISVLLRG